MTNSSYNLLRRKDHFISSIFSRNSEADTSEFLENIEEMFTDY